MKTVPLFIGDEDGLRDVVQKRGRRKTDGVYDAEYGHQTKLRRVDLSLTQEELAIKAGIHQVTLCRIEKATCPLTERMRAKIEKVLVELECHCPAHEYIGRECTCTCVHSA